MNTDRTVVALPDAVPTVRAANYMPVAQGREWGPRAIGDWELIFVVRGEMAYRRIGGNITKLYQGDVLCITPGEEHCYTNTTGGEAVFSCIHLEIGPGRWRSGDYTLASHPPLVTSTGSDPVFPYLFKHCSDTFEGYDPYRSRLVNVIAHEIWLHLASIWKSPATQAPSPRTRRMQEFLRERLEQPVSRQDLAEAFHLSPERVNAIFKREVGVSPGAFVQRERVILAYEKLAYEGLSVKEAAYSTGFTDPFHFSKVFKKIMGIPPSHLLQCSGRCPKDSR